jgi:hypothetical protein
MYLEVELLGPMVILCLAFSRTPILNSHYVTFLYFLAMFVLFLVVAILTGVKCDLIDISYIYLRLSVFHVLFLYHL